MNIIEENMFKGDKISLFLIDFFAKFSKNSSNDFDFFSFIIKILLDMISSNPSPDLRVNHLKIFNF